MLLCENSIINLRNSITIGNIIIAKGEIIPDNEKI